MNMDSQGRKTSTEVEKGVEPSQTTTNLVSNHIVIENITTFFQSTINSTRQVQIQMFLDQMPTDQQQIEEAMFPHCKLNVGNSNHPIMIDIVQTRLMDYYTIYRKTQWYRKNLAHRGFMHLWMANKKTIRLLWSKQNSKVSNTSISIFINPGAC